YTLGDVRTVLYLQITRQQPQTKLFPYTTLFRSKQTVGKLRKVDLLTEKDRAVMEKQQNPKYIARRYRLWWYGHTIAFIIANIIFWQLYGDKAIEFLSYIQDWSWFEEETIHHAPYKHEMVMNIVRLWLVIYV